MAERGTQVGRSLPSSWDSNLLCFIVNVCVCVCVCVRCMSVPNEVLCDLNAWETLYELRSCISQLLPQ